jgi:hypothetical protein
MSVQFERLKTYLSLLVALVAKYRQSDKDNTVLITSLNEQLAAQSVVAERLSFDLFNTQSQLTTALSNDIADAQTIADSVATIEASNAQIAELKDRAIALGVSVEEAFTAVEVAKAESLAAQESADAAKAELAASEENFAGLADVAQSLVEPIPEG